jgi:hypothetical protein
MIDPVIQLMVDAATAILDSTDGRGAIEITLTIPGMLVSGCVSSQRDFLLHHPLPEKVLELYETHPLFKQIREEPSVEEKGATEFIHLSDAHFYTPGGTLIFPSGGEGVHWRGRLDSVCGFHFGRPVVVR